MPADPAEFFQHSAWATERLVEVCADLADEQLDATGDGTYGSIRNTLLHLLSAEQYYLSRIGHPAAGPAVTFEFPGFDVLRQAAQANGAALAEAAMTSTPDYYVEGGDGDEFTQAAYSVFLIQALSHSAEHRTHILSILGTLGVGPADFDAQIDGWSWGGESGTLTPKVS